MKTTILIAVLCGMVAAAARGFGADASGVAGPAPASSPVVVLDYQEVSYPLVNQSCFFPKEPVAFKKEPDFGKRSVFRSTLRLGGEHTNSIPFVWDQSEGRLYLDLNRNRDLTDDLPGGVAGPRDGTSQTFTNLAVVLKTPSGPHRFLLDLNMSRCSGNSQVFGNVSVRSWWQGKAVLQGQECQVGLVENVFGGSSAGGGASLILRPWSARTDRVELASGTADAIHYASKLFWRKQAYELSRRFDGLGAAEQCKLEFKARDVTLGELKLTGGLVHRLILEDSKGYTAVLDTPEPVVKIPTGAYKVSEVWVRQGAAEAIQTMSRQITVSEKSPASLRAGGPLTNSVSLSRRGKYLVLAYQVVGADGFPYRVTKEDRSKPPEFAIYHGGKKVHSGKFAYG